MQSLLSQHAYVIGETGHFDARTGRALVAIRKRLGLSRTATFDNALATRLAKGQGDFTVKFPGHGRHVEANLSQQLLALIGAGGKVERVYTTSSGKPSTPTVLGSYSVYRKDLGTNAKGMVDSSYFIRGYAIHGYAEVPTYNASHGCLRVPVPDALSIFRWVQYGTKVDVYR
ncbi:MAG: L,D-transpeptidase, partial [Patulibacter sp.]|nr:L,D-transpeptidase [Patulibacter sp.]